MAKISMTADGIHSAILVCNRCGAHTEKGYVYPRGWSHIDVRVSGDDDMPLLWDLCPECTKTVMGYITDRMSV